MMQAILKTFLSCFFTGRVIVMLIKFFSPVKTIVFNKHLFFAKQLVQFAVKFSDPEG